MDDPGLRDLDELLRGLAPTIRPGQFVMVSTNSLSSLPALATVVEDEGTSLVIERHTADAFRLDYSEVFGWITLTVHSSLAAVGLTAAVAGALAVDGIPCNVLAGFHHDHLLVPTDRVDDALSALAALSEGAAVRRPERVDGAGTDVGAPA
jgi:hypothetical protein